MTIFENRLNIGLFKLTAVLWDEGKAVTRGRSTPLTVLVSLYDDVWIPGSIYEYNEQPHHPGNNLP